MEVHEVAQSFYAQRKMVASLRKTTPRERIAKLFALKREIEKRRTEIYQACFSDLKKPEPEVDLGEIFPVYTEIKHAIKNLKKWMRPTKVRTPLSLFGSVSECRYESKGVVLIISPWNYPINLCLSPLVSAIAAGNAVIMKPSELAPCTSKILKLIISNVFPTNEVQLFEGGIALSQRLLDLPFNHIFFTGSPRVGKVVMNAAAKHLASITLELGGKSPVIITETADLHKAARNVLWAKFINAGQTCLAPDHIYIHETVAERFIQYCVNEIERIYGATSELQQKNPDYCRIVNRGHYERLMSLLQDAVKTGATIMSGGTGDGDTLFISPTLMSDIDMDSTIMQEEIFGPLLPIISYREVEAVIEDITIRPAPLGLYLFGRDNDTIEHLDKSIPAGGVTINNAVLHFSNPHLPFGGLNASGIGNSHGLFGFKSFSHERAILRDRFCLSRLTYPPYSRFTRGFIKSTIRFLS